MVGGIIGKYKVMLESLVPLGCKATRVSLIRQWRVDWVIDIVSQLHQSWNLFLHISANTS